MNKCIVFAKAIPLQRIGTKAQAQKDILCITYTVCLYHKATELAEDGTQNTVQSLKRGRVNERWSPRMMTSFPLPLFSAWSAVQLRSKRQWLL